MSKPKIYVIGSTEQADRVRSTAKYYISTGDYEVKCRPGFKDEDKETYKHIMNTLWADRIYIVPNVDGHLTPGLLLTKITATMLGKRVEQYRTEKEISDWINRMKSE